MEVKRLLALSGAAVLVLATACQEDSGTAPTLSLTCSSTPSSGSAPLAVAYALNVAGAEGSFSVAINYGDGASGSDPDARHTYSAAGVFTTSFTVTTETQSARCATTTTVTEAGTLPPGSGPTPSPTPTNAAPHAVFRTTPAAGAGDRIEGVGSLSVRFNMCPSSDPENDPLRFTMDLNGDGRNDVDGVTGVDCRHDWDYGSGTYKAENCVTDLGPTGQPLHGFQCKTWTIVVQ